MAKRRENFPHEKIETKDESAHFKGHIYPIPHSTNLQQMTLKKSRQNYGKSLKEEVNYCKE